MNLIKYIFSFKSHDKNITELQAFIYVCGFLCHTESSRRLRTYIDCDCDMKKTLALLQDVSASALRSSVCYANNKLKKLLGSDIAERLATDDALGKSILASAQLMSQPLLLKPVAHCIPSFKNERFCVEDCAAELLFLSRFSTCNFNFYLKHMDMKKLSYLYHVITEPCDSDRLLSLKLRQWLSTSCNAKPEDAAAIIQDIHSSKPIKP